MNGLSWYWLLTFIYMTPYRYALKVYLFIYPYRCSKTLKTVCFMSHWYFTWFRARVWKEATTKEKSWPQCLPPSVVCGPSLSSSQGVWRFGLLTLNVEVRSLRTIWIALLEKRFQKEVFARRFITLPPRLPLALFFYLRSFVVSLLSLLRAQLAWYRFLSLVRSLSFARNLVFDSPVRKHPVQWCQTGFKQ